MARRRALGVGTVVLGMAACTGAAIGCQLVIGYRDGFLESGTGGGAAATCSDGKQNGEETATDCGGPDCPRCSDGKTCAKGSDCQSGLCQTMCQTNYVWAKRFGDAEDQQANAVAVDTVGDALVTGKVTGTVDFGNGAQPTVSSPSPFLATLDPRGKALDGSGVFPDMGMGGEGMAVTFATYSNVLGATLMAGGFSGSLAFDDGGASTTDDAGGTIAIPDGGVATAAFQSPFSMSVLGGYVYEHTYNGSAGAYAQAVTGIAVDNSNPPSLFMTGYANGADFGCGPISYPNEPSLFVVKLGSPCAWSTTFGGNAHASASIAVDAAGNVVLAGGFRNLSQAQGTATLDFGNGYKIATAAQNLTAIFIAKVNASTGLGMWARPFGDTTGGGIATAVAVDSAGNILVTGTFNGTVDFGDGPLVSKGSSSVFVVERDSSGDHIWSKAFGDANVTNATAPVGIGLDASGNIIIAGHFDGSLDFGGSPLTSNGSTDVFAVKLDPKGNHLWSRSYGDAQKQTSAGVAVAPTGNLILAGTFAGAIDFGGGPLTSAGGTDIFVATLHTP